MIMKLPFEHVQVKFSNDLKQPGLGKLRCLRREMLSSPPRTTRLRHHPALYILDPTSWEYFNLRNKRRQVHSKIFPPPPQDWPFPCIAVLIVNSVFKLKKVFWKRCKLSNLPACRTAN